MQGRGCGLLKYRELAQAFHKVEIRNGNTTSFWFDAWSPLRKLWDLAGARGKIDKGISIHATVRMVLSLHRRRRHQLDSLNNIEDEIYKAI